jgi:hypothetical protein
MGPRTKLLAMLAVAGACGLFALPSTAGAAARSGVTIHEKGGGGFKGFVFSPKPGKCADGRMVSLLKKTENGAERLEVTHASKDSDGRYRWRASEFPLRPGRFYARVSKTSACQADDSKTLRITARPNTKITSVSIQHRDNRAIFEYHAEGGFKPYRLFCRLDRHRVEDCGNTRESFGDVSPGRHVFRVWAKGANDRKERRPAKRRFKM